MKAILLLSILTAFASSFGADDQLEGNQERRSLDKFDRTIIDAHEQGFPASCIPSSVEMVLKLMGRVPGSYRDLQRAWQNKSDGSFRDFNGKTFEGVTFRHQFALARNGDFPMAQLFETIHNELHAGRFVIIGLASPGGWHNWVIYGEDADGEFLAISKDGKRTIEERQVKKAIIRMQGTDIGTYEYPCSPIRLPSAPPQFRPRGFHL